MECNTATTTQNNVDEPHKVLSKISQPQRSTCMSLSIKVQNRAKLIYGGGIQESGYPWERDW